MLHKANVSLASGLPHIEVDTNDTPFLLSALYGSTTMHTMSILPKDDVTSKEGAALYRYLPKIGDSSLTINAAIELREARRQGELDDKEADTAAGDAGGAGGPARPVEENTMSDGGHGA